jgi:hypothetical protein
MSTVGEAGTITTIDANTIPSVTGNGGSLTKGDPEEQWTTVHLQGTYTDPVVIIGVPSEVGGEEAVPRLRNLRYGPAAPDDGCDGHCFDVRMQEPSCRDDRSGPARGLQAPLAFRIVHILSYEAFRMGVQCA